MLCKFFLFDSFVSHEFLIYLCFIFLFMHVFFINLEEEIGESEFRNLSYETMVFFIKKIGPRNNFWLKYKALQLNLNKEQVDFVFANIWFLFYCCFFAC